MDRGLVGCDIRSLSLDLDLVLGLGIVDFVKVVKMSERRLELRVALLAALFSWGSRAACQARSYGAIT